MKLSGALGLLASAIACAGAALYFFRSPSATYNNPVGVGLKWSLPLVAAAFLVMSVTYFV